MSRCAGISGLLLGHKYVARYSYGAPTIGILRVGAPWRAERIISASKPATYERDVCERCGAVIVRTERGEA